MNTAVSSTPKGATKGRVAIAALLAFCALGMLIGSSSAKAAKNDPFAVDFNYVCLLYTSPSPRDGLLSRMPSSA